VENRGGDATIPVMQAAKGAPDGHTLMSIGGNFFWLQPLLRDGVPYDPVKDFAPVTLTASAPNLLIVSASLPVRNVRELIALAKANPGKLDFGHANVGSGNHLAAELFKSMSKTNIVLVTYKGAPAAMNAVLSGEVQAFFPGVSTALSLVKAGKVRALAVTTEQRTDLAPGIPTVSESGLPGFTSGADYVVFTPAKTPTPIIERLNRIIVQYLHDPEVRKMLFNQGLVVAGSTPAELARYMKTEIERVDKMIREQGIRFK
jgi:tripartite-type tricarboxylate transporter receptor subunit TctC